MGYHGKRYLSEFLVPQDEGVQDGYMQGNQRLEVTLLCNTGGQWSGGMFVRNVQGGVPRTSVVGVGTRGHGKRFGPDLWIVCIPTRCSAGCAGGGSCRRSSLVVERH